MSDVQPPEVPEEYSEAYQRAYRQYVEEHPTGMFSPARPGKRAVRPTTLGALRGKLAGTLAGLLSDSRKRPSLAAVTFAALVLVAYGIGRLLS
ncbi:MAG TPA: hypothetical protein VN108_03055 [Marmoricola sp.]|nr:hypothetical protein [Marmoricola sp.]